MEAEPGFLKPALTAMSAVVEKAKEKGEEVLVNLVIDEMKIQAHVDLDWEKFFGHVDLGHQLEDKDLLPYAEDALVFMAVSVNSSWKVPFGYFLIASVNAEEKANLVSLGIKQLHDVGVKVVSFVCDGPPTNLAMLGDLGMCVKPDNIKSDFSNPADPDSKIYGMLDCCHMLKLVRNSWSNSRRYGVMHILKKMLTFYITHSR